MGERFVPERCKIEGAGQTGAREQLERGNLFKKRDV